MLDDLASLVDQSLVVRRDAPDGEPRFTMLETIREYALEQLTAQGETDVWQRRHAAYFLTLAEQAEPDLWRGANTGETMQRVEREHGNLRAALGWAITSGERELALRLVGALQAFWIFGGYLSEGRRWLEEAVADTGSVTSKALAQAFFGLGRIREEQGDYPRAEWAFEKSLSLARRLGDLSGMGGCLVSLGGALFERGEVGRAAALFEESLSLYREAEDPSGIAWSLYGLGRVAQAQGGPERAAALFEESLALHSSSGHHRGMATALNALGLLHRFQRDYAQAARYLEQSLALRRAVGDRSGLAGALLRLGVLLGGGGDFGRAATLLGESLTLSRELGTPLAISNGLLAFGGLAGRRGQLDRAARLFGAGEALLEANGASVMAEYRGLYGRTVARVCAALGEAAFAAAYAAGRALSLDAAVALALEQVGADLRRART